MSTLSCILMGYFVGNINPAYILGKLSGFDIREHGSGNAGASNALILMGKLKGALVALFDILKAYFSFRFAKFCFPLLQFAGILAGGACILGHIFPVWMHFSGGKGLACLGGVILAYSWKFFCAILAVELLLALITDYICVVAMSASVVFTVVYFFQTSDIVGTLFLAVLAIVINCKHIENIRRIMEGKEARFSFLWRKEEEIERLQEHYKEM